MVCGAGGTASSWETGWPKVMRWAANLGGTAMVVSGASGFLKMVAGLTLGLQSASRAGREISGWKLDVGTRRKCMEWEAASYNFPSRGGEGLNAPRVVRELLVSSSLLCLVDDDMRFDDAITLRDPGSRVLRWKLGFPSCHHQYGTDRAHIAVVRMFQLRLSSDAQTAHRPAQASTQERVTRTSPPPGGLLPRRANTTRSRPSRRPSRKSSPVCTVPPPGVRKEKTAPYWAYRNAGPGWDPAPAAEPPRCAGPDMLRPRTPHPGKRKANINFKLLPLTASSLPQTQSPTALFRPLA